MHNLGLIGGTFDRFHAGHRKLIRIALEKCNKIEIWIISDEIASKNNVLTMNWQDRKNDIISNLDEDSLSKVEFGLLEDKYGPAPNHPNASAIICTPETVGICVEINKMRKSKILDELEIIEVGHENAWDGKPISSTRIRNGEIDRLGNSWIYPYFNPISKDVVATDLVMTKHAEKMLKQPFGELIEGKDEDYEYAMKIVMEKYLNNEVPLIAVGDVTTLTLQELDNCADVALIDGKTKREEWVQAKNIDSKRYDNYLTCVNPAGRLTKSLFEVCKLSLEKWLVDKSTCIINVEGEEDLAPLIIHLVAPLGTILVYGQPGRGLVVRITEEETKKRCKEILSSFDTL